MRNVSDKSFKENENTRLVLKNVLSKIIPKIVPFMR